MRLPTALVVGPMKAGTTWIQDYLTWRGDVCLPAAVKETMFFDLNFFRGNSWYSSHFSYHSTSSHAAVVEVAPSLFHCVEAPERVRETLGTVPLIVTTREPVARAWSHYLHLRRKGYASDPLHRAIKTHPEIVSASRYTIHIDRWRGAFPDSSLTILPLEDLVDDRERYAERLCSALGIVARNPPATLGASNATGIPPSFWLARLGSSAAAGLRSAGGYGAVNFAKSLGLKRVFFGADGGKRLEMTAEERELLESLLGTGKTRP